MPKSMKENIILTGPPRSGTTLTCHLLNQLEDVVALHEPMNLSHFPSREEAMANLSSFFREMRQLILTEGKAISRIQDGKIPTNPFEKGTHERKSLVKKGYFTLDKKLQPNFHLVIKHNGHFLYLLPELLEEYTCFAVIRNPLATLASWNSIQAPVADGNLRVLKTLQPKLWQTLEDIPDKLDRQVELLDSLFTQMNAFDANHIIKYEDIVNSGGKILASLHPAAEKLEEKLSNLSVNNRYDQNLMTQLADKLEKKQGAWMNHYSSSDISSLLK
jgi:hypothetical protein